MDSSLKSVLADTPFDAPLNEIYHEQAALSQDYDVLKLWSERKHVPKKYVDLFFNVIPNPEVKGLMYKHFDVDQIVFYLESCYSSAPEKIIQTARIALMEGFVNCSVKDAVKLFAYSSKFFDPSDANLAPSIPFHVSGVLLDAIVSGQYYCETDAVKALEVLFAANFPSFNALPECQKIPRLALKAALVHFKAAPVLPLILAFDIFKVLAGSVCFTSEVEDLRQEFIEAFNTKILPSIYIAMPKPSEVQSEWVNGSIVDFILWLSPDSSGIERKLLPVESCEKLDLLATCEDFIYQAASLPLGPTVSVIAKRLNDSTSDEVEKALRSEDIVSLPDVNSDDFWMKLTRLLSEETLLDAINVMRFSPAIKYMTPALCEEFIHRGLTNWEVFKPFTFDLIREPMRAVNAESFIISKEDSFKPDAFSVLAETYTGTFGELIETVRVL